MTRFFRIALKAAGAALALSLAGTAAADGLREELQRCAQLQSAEVRLACYDALAGTSAAQPQSASAANVPSAGSTGSVPAVATPGASSGNAQAASEPAAQPESERSLTQRVFGMLPGGGEVRKIESRVVGEVDGLGPGKRFELENGQVWRQVDRTNRNYRATNPRVEIREGFMNSYRMRFEGLNARIRVRRLK